MNKNPLNDMTTILTTKLLWRLLKPIITHISHKTNNDIDNKIVETIDNFIKSV